MRKHAWAFGGGIEIAKKSDPLRVLASVVEQAERERTRPLARLRALFVLSVLRRSSSARGTDCVAGTALLDWRLDFVAGAALLQTQAQIA